MRVAVVHDKLWQFGGGERVAVALRELWPGDPLYTSTFDPQIVASIGVPVAATWLQRVPLLETAHHYFLPAYDRAFRSLDLSGYDLVVSSSAMFAKSVRPAPGTPHICYCHTPPRFLWDLRGSLIDELPHSGSIKRGVAAMTTWLRRVDRMAAERVTRFVANSEHVAGRILDFYGREADVIYPPVDLGVGRTNRTKGDHVLVLARLFPYKRVDLVIAACNRLELPLEIVGEGSDRARLEALAGPRVTFRGWVSESLKDELVGSARVLVAPQVEDFGIATVEAIAAGTPVLALRAGGATEIIREGVSGEFFADQTENAVIEALASFDEAAYDPEAMRSSVSRFSAERFESEMRSYAASVAASG